jgi:hypothetical protein
MPTFEEFLKSATPERIAEQARRAESFGMTPEEFYIDTQKRLSSPEAKQTIVRLAKELVKKSRKSR